MERRPDYIVIDDLDDDELCRNPSRVTDMMAWVKEALFGCLDVGRGRFIMAGNLIAKNSVLQGICETEGVKVSTIVAVDMAAFDGGVIAADMQLSRVKYTRALEEKGEIPPLNSDSLTGAPGVGQSVAQVLHNTDERVEKLLKTEN